MDLDGPIEVHRVAHDILHGAGVRCLTIKGPATADLLYADSVRVSSDADVLVSPHQLKRALAALRAAGFVSMDAGLRAAERSSHSTTLAHPKLATTLDLHNQFPGLGVAPEVAWQRLWAEHVSLSVAGVQLGVPAPAATVLFIALHAARNGYGDSLSSTDLRRALARLDDELWRDAFHLAAQLSASEGLVAGLRYLPRGRELSSRFAPAVTVPHEWSLSQLPDAFLAQRWAQMRNKPGRELPGFLAAELLPSRAFMQLDWPMARRGPLGLLVAHLQRWFSLARRLPAVIFAVRRMRRDG